MSARGSAHVPDGPSFPTSSPRASPPMTDRPAVPQRNQRASSDANFNRSRSFSVSETDLLDAAVIINDCDRQEFSHLLSSTRGHADNVLPKKLLQELLTSLGLDLANDARLENTRLVLNKLPEELDVEDYVRFRSSTVLCGRALRGELKIPDWASFRTQIASIFDRVAEETGGNVANYIPQLSRVDPDLFGISVCSVDGQRLNLGDSDEYFSIQSTGKPFIYGFALQEAMDRLGDDEQGEEFVHAHVGREPSGRGFSERILNPDGLPHNPHLNSGAIMCSALIQRHRDIADRFDYVMMLFQKLTDPSGTVSFANAIYLAEKATSMRNYCLGYMMAEEGCFPPGTDLLTTEDFYFMLCSIMMTTEMLSVAAATLANNGINPCTGKRIFGERTVRNILSLTASCGLYEESGEYAFRFGFPVKAGASGALLIVLPGVAGMCVWSPRLDARHNSVRGIKFCHEIASSFNFHHFDDLIWGRSLKLDPTELKGPAAKFHDWADLWWSSAWGDLVELRRLIARGIDLNAQDYDGRSALHLAAAYGGVDAVRMLLAHGADIDVVDRLGQTPLDAARRWKHATCIELLEAAVGNVPAYRLLSNEHLDPEGVPHGQLFRALDFFGKGEVPRSRLEEVLAEEGFSNEHAPHTCELFRELRADGRPFTASMFRDFVERFPLCKSAILGSQVVQNFGDFSVRVKDIYDYVSTDLGGKVASYIPALAKADPNPFGVSCCTLSGQQFDIGDSNVRYGMQSCSKVINYCIAQMELGDEPLHEFVGREPSGLNFNEIVLNHQRKPHNPFINSGAIMVCSLIRPYDALADRFTFVQSIWQDLTGGQATVFNSEMFEGERKTADRNRCLAYMLKDADAFPPWIKTSRDLKATLDLYLMSCSMEITAQQMAVVAATLANGGTNPLTGKQIFPPHIVRNALSLMASCGMYNFSGEFAFRVGFPCKSGVGGGLLIVIPGLMGISTFSPRVDGNGNSVRGVKFCYELSSRFNFHTYDSLVRGKYDPTIHGGSDVRRRTNDLIHAASTNDLVEIKRLVRSCGTDVNAVDYDQRSPLHLAAQNGHKDAVKLLLHLGADPKVIDCWDQTPEDCALAFGAPRIVEILRTAAVSHDDEDEIEDFDTGKPTL